MEGTYWNPLKDRGVVATCNVSNCHYESYSSPTLAVPTTTVTTPAALPIPSSAPILPTPTMPTSIVNAPVVVPSMDIDVQSTTPVSNPMETYTTPPPSVYLPTVSPPLLGGVVPPITQRRVIVWFQSECAVCRNNEPLIRALTEIGRNAQPPFTVHLVEATPERLQVYKHVNVVPLYDVVEPGLTTDPVYGPGTMLTTVRNDLSALQTLFPGITQMIERLQSPPSS